MPSRSSAAGSSGRIDPRPGRGRTSGAGGVSTAPGPRRSLPRRAVIARAALAGAGILCGGSLGACRAFGSARPRSAATTLHVTIQLSLQVSGVGVATATALVQQYVDEHFNATHKGIYAQYVPWGNSPSQIAEILAGRGPYVIDTGACATCWPTIQPACFGACRPGISVHAGHSFRWMPAGYFGGMPAAFGPIPKWVAGMPRWG